MDPQIELAIKKMRTCPKCGGIDTYAFQRISKPMAKKDGTYAFCVECKVRWQLSTEFGFPDAIAEDEDTAVEVSNRILEHTTEYLP